MASSPPSLPSSLPLPDDCAVCLQPLLQPVRLPCAHVFCFLCVKGASARNRSCPMCRSRIPHNYMDQPELVTGNNEEEDGDDDDDAAGEVKECQVGQLEEVQAGQQQQEQYRWFYEGNNGWWQYDDRTSIDLERAHAAGEASTVLLIAGFNYVVDFSAMLQCRQSDPNRRRKIKRDRVNVPKKGIAGIRVNGTAPVAAGPSRLQPQVHVPVRPTQQPPVPPPLPQAPPQAARQHQPSPSLVNRGVHAIQQILASSTLQDDDDGNPASSPATSTTQTSSRNPAAPIPQPRASSSSQISPVLTGNHRAPISSPQLPPAIMRGRGNQHQAASPEDDEDDEEEEEEEEIV